MVTEKRALGDLGEHLARKYLISKGYEIVESNLRIGRAEIDIVARTNDQLVFVEVKTRKSIEYGFPEESVSKHKTEMMIEAADVYCLDHPEEQGVRLDIISIIMLPNRTEIKHFEDAIDPWQD